MAINTKYRGSNINDKKNFFLLIFHTVYYNTITAKHPHCGLPRIKGGMIKHRPMN